MSTSTVRSAISSGPSSVGDVTGLMFASAFYMIGFGQYIVEPLPFLDGRILIVGLGLAGLLVPRWRQLQRN